MKDADSILTAIATALYREKLKQLRMENHPIVIDIEDALAEALLSLILSGIYDVEQLGIAKESAEWIRCRYLH